MEVRKEAVIAYRVWDVMVGSSRDGEVAGLSAIGKPVVWPRLKRLEATCNKGFIKSIALQTVHLEDAPLSTCTCGIYAFKEEDLVVDHLADSTASSSRVAGRVALWGDVVVCERGYRAQYAYPQVLYYTEKNVELVRKLAADYGIEAVPLAPHIVEAVKSHPGDSMGGLIAQMVAYATKLQSELSIGYTIGFDVGISPREQAKSRIMRLAYGGKPADVVIYDDLVDAVDESMKKAYSQKTLSHPFSKFITDTSKEKRSGRPR